VILGRGFGDADEVDQRRDGHRDGPAKPDRHGVAAQVAVTLRAGEGGGDHELEPVGRKSSAELRDLTVGISRSGRRRRAFPEGQAAQVMHVGPYRASTASACSGAVFASP
jgi:hypothetical protein